MRLEEEIKQKKFASAYHKLVVNVLFSGNWLREQHGEDLQRFGITMQQFNVLRILRGQAPASASIGLVKKRMLDKQSDVSRLVERLRLKGLLQRKLAKNDRRKCEINITEKGLALLAEIDHSMTCWYDRLKGLSAREAEECSRILDKMRSSAAAKPIDRDSY
jgi:MarR family transcriptional regulator, multiple gene regulator MgrA